MKEVMLKDYQQHHLFSGAQVKECEQCRLCWGSPAITGKKSLQKITQGLSADVILTTGGVFVGEYDFV
jgi:hypothetical protein